MIEVRLIGRLLGMLLLVLSALLLATALFGFLDDWAGTSHSYSDVYALLLSAGAGCALGGVLIFSGKTSPNLIGRREALVLVVLSWMLGAVLSSLPFSFWSQLRPDAKESAHPFDSFVNCYFEATSGLTTTGSTILPSIGTLPNSLLLWRSVTQWLGGLGIVVLFVAVLPLLGVGGRRLLRIEGGAIRTGVRPQIRDAARALLYVYIGLTVLGTVALRIAGMSWFDAVNHTFAGLSTAGFSTKDASVGAYSSSAIHVTIIAIMLAGSINFVLYYQAIQGRWRAAIRDPELRVHLILYSCGVAIVTAVLILQTPAMYLDAEGNRAGFGLLLRDAAFQVATFHTTTGFATADFDTWAFSAKAVLISLCFVGGCVGATTGGLKVSRIMIAAKIFHEELERTYQPSVVRATTIGGATVASDVKTSTLVFLLLYAATFGLGTAALMISEGSGQIDIVTAATATSATMNTTGPGLGGVGPTKTFEWLSVPGKLICCVLMTLGRLEILAVVVLLMPRFWREE